MNIIHDGWIRREPVLSGAELRELEARVSALRALKRELSIAEHGAINAALTRAHEVRDADVSSPVTAAAIEAARAVSAELATLLEQMTPAAPVASVVAPAPIASAAPVGALVLSPVTAPTRKDSTKRRAA